MGELSLTWHEDEVGVAELPLKVQAGDRRLLVLGTFNAPQADPAVVIVALPLPEGQEKTKIDLSKPVVEIVPREALEGKIIARLELYRLNWQSLGGSSQLGPMGQEEAGSPHITWQGPKHFGKMWLDLNKGSVEVQFGVFDSTDRELEFRIRGEVHPGGQPAQFILHASGDPELRLLWEGTTTQEGDCVSFTGAVRQATVQESAKAIESLRWPLYAYEENSWGWVLLALLQALSEAANRTASYILKIQIALPPCVVALPRGFSRSFFGPELPIALGNAPQPEYEHREPLKVSSPTINEFVSFSVTAPPVVTPGRTFVVDVWAYLQAQRDEMLRRAHEATQGAKIAIREKGPVRIERGTVISVHLGITDLQIAHPEDTLLWEGEIANASFAVTVPRKVAPGEKAGRVTFFVGGLQTASLDFIIAVRKKAALPEELPFEVKHYKTAFASYADEDRDEVLSVIQGMQKIIPSLDVFMDVLSLRSGQRWEQELWKEIPRRDVFYLFWSQSARESEWVEKEWRCALGARGMDFIDPVPLVSPKSVPPPRELGELHFNDWMLAFKRQRKAVTYD